MGHFYTRNWKVYNEVLKRRWSLDLWLAPEVIRSWYHRKHHGRRGADLTYTKQAIQACLMVRSLFHLSLRATEGFMRSLFERLSLDIRCPSYSQLSRRSEGLSRLALARSNKGKAFYMLVDTTGLKVYGEGEWHVKIHKASRRRTWRKLHIAIDPVTQEILEVKLTKSQCADSTMLPWLLKAVKDPICKLWADGAYDQRPVYQTLYQRGIQPIIPPRQGAQPCYAYYTQRYLGRRRFVHSDPPLFHRDQAIDFIAQFMDKREGRKVWEQSAGYGIRSLVEASIMRFKRTFTDKLQARKLNTQQAEVRVKCLLLNKMLQLGGPYTVRLPHPSLISHQT